MARYVVLAFEDDAQAEAFVKYASRGDVPVRVEYVGYNEYEIDDVPVTVRAVYQKPTKVCECPPGTFGRSRGSKYGWYVCNKCGKPPKAWANGTPWYIALGKNLLPVSEQAPEYRGPK